MQGQHANDGELARFRVTLTPVPVPLYAIIDLTKAPGADGQIEYVYEADLTNDVWGTWVRNPVTNNGEVIKSVIWTGVTNDAVYKTDKLVLRRVPAGDFMMGSGSGARAIKLTQACYAGVFEITQMQYCRITGGAAPAAPDQGKPQVISYFNLRGMTNGVPDINWPMTGHTVASNSFIGILREKTGINGFDLPTDAQWEYLCRAGTTTDFNSGEMKTDDFTNTVNRLAWWRDNSGRVAQTVGQKRPNAWGLYDTHGNAWEWCLDWYTGTLVAATDPVGPEISSESPPTRVRRGGGAYDEWNWQRSFARTRDGKPEIGYGFRLVWTLP